MPGTGSPRPLRARNPERESEKSPERVPLGVPPRGALSGLLSDSFGVPGPKGPGDPVPGRADPNQEGFKGGSSVEAPKPHSDSSSLRFGSDAVGLPNCNSDSHLFVRARKRDFPFFLWGNPRPEPSPNPSPWRLPFFY